MNLHTFIRNFGPDTQHTQPDRTFQAFYQRNKLHTICSVILGSLFFVFFRWLKWRNSLPLFFFVIILVNDDEKYRTTKAFFSRFCLRLGDFEKKNKQQAITINRKWTWTYLASFAKQQETNWTFQHIHNQPTRKKLPKKKPAK